MISTEIQRVVLLLALGVVGYLLLQAWTRDYRQAATEPLPVVSEAPGEDAPVAVPPSDVPEPQAAGDVPGEDLASSDREVAQTSSVAGRLVHVRTPTLDVTIDLVGGDIVDLRLPKYPATIDDVLPVVLLQRSSSHIYVAQSGLIGRDGRDNKDARPVYTAGSTEYEVDEGPLVVSLAHEAEGVSVVKRFLFDADDYLVTVEYDVDNAAETEFRAQLFAQLKRDASRPGTGGGFSMGPRPYVGAAFTTPDSRYEKVDFEDLDDEQFRVAVAGGWAAVLQHYFLSAWVGDTDEVNSYYGRRLPDGNYAVGFVGPEVVIPPGRGGAVSARFYAGPKIQKRLEEIAPNLNLTVDYGFLWWLSVPLFYVLDAIHSVVQNWGVGDHPAHVGSEGPAVPTGVRGFSIHGEDEAGHAADEAAPRTPCGRSSKALPGDDGAVSEGGREPVRWLPAPAPADAGIFRVVLGPLRKCRTPSGAVHPVDQ